MCKHTLLEALVIARSSHSKWCLELPASFSACPPNGLLGGGHSVSSPGDGGGVGVTVGSGVLGGGGGQSV